VLCAAGEKCSGCWLVKWRTMVVVVWWSRGGQGIYIGLAFGP
jgi:hypothetical protein